jgi:DNA modification methylase
MIIEIKKISELTPAPYNPRESTEKQESQLKQSLKKFGVVEPIIYNKQTGYIVGGHFRVRELQKLGYTEIECVIVDLSEEDEKELNIRLNANTGQWDWDELANNFELEDLNDWGLEVPNMKHELEAEDDNFEDPENIETDIVLGDLFEIGEHRLLCGDSTDSDAVARLMDGNKADMVFTSPPYNANASVNGKKLYENNNLDNKSEDEYLKFLDEIKDSFYTILKSKGIVCWNIMYNNNSRQSFIKNVNRFIESGLLLTETIIWKKNAIPLTKGLSRAFEFIFIFQKDELDFSYQDKHSYNENVWEISNAKTQIESHKACFPVELPSNGIKLFTKENMILFEPFTGSGTTMVASHQLKRKCYGMELDPKYCQVIIDRMKNLDPTIKIKRNGVEL